MKYETTTVTIGGITSNEDYSHSFPIQTLTAIVPQSADLVVEPYGIFIAASQIDHLVPKWSVERWYSQTAKIWPSGQTSHTEGITYVENVPLGVNEYLDENGIYLDATKFKGKDTSGGNQRLDKSMFFISLIIASLIVTLTV
ncbi:unnamed protein product [Debaryomyces tyrocola]|nr:unnamed protein product [Debaryomyces tyrocola]